MYRLLQYVHFLMREYNHIVLTVQRPDDGLSLIHILTDNHQSAAAEDCLKIYLSDTDNSIDCVAGK